MCGRTDGNSSVSPTFASPSGLTPLADNYDLNELWYEYEAKKTAAREAEITTKAMDVEA